MAAFRLLRALALATLCTCLAAAGTEPAFARGEVLINGVPARPARARDYYPADLRRANVGGRVSLAYSIDASGRVVRVFPLVSDDVRFEPAATQCLTDLRFRVPADWEARGGPWRRFRIQVTFVVRGMQPLPKWDPTDEALVITASGR